MDELKRTQMEGKRIYGQFVREMDGSTDAKETWKWLRKADLKVQTDLVCAQHRTNYVKNHIEK